MSGNMLLATASGLQITAYELVLLHVRYPDIGWSARQRLKELEQENSKLKRRVAAQAALEFGLSANAKPKRQGFAGKAFAVLGRDNAALNQIMGNLKKANFLTPLAEGVSEIAWALFGSAATLEQRIVYTKPVLRDASPKVPGSQPRIESSSVEIEGAY